jgi:PadR family transcriptional regulator, regulatory protein PadR
VPAGGPAHGYAVAYAPRERGAQEFTLPEGTVDPASHRLEDAGLLRSYRAEQAGRRRRLDELTARCSGPAERAWFERVVRRQLGPGVEWVGEADGPAKKELLARAGCLLLPTPSTSGPSTSPEPAGRAP